MFAIPPRDGEDPPRERRGGARRLVMWLTGLFVAALGATILGVVTGIPGELIDLDSAKDRLRQGPDLRASVNVIHLDDQGYSMAFADEYMPTQHQSQLMRALGDYEKREELSFDLRRSGGVDVERLTLQVVLEGRSNQEIRVVDIRPTDVERTAPLDGTLFSTPPQAGGASIVLLLDMDQPTPVMNVVAGTDESGPVPGQPYFENNNIRLADREQDVLVIRTSAMKSTVRFRLKIEYLIGGDSKSIVIDDDGVPFGITPINCVRRGLVSYRKGYEFGSPKDHPDKWEVISAQVLKQLDNANLPPRAQESISCLTP